MFGMLLVYPGNKDSFFFIVLKRSIQVLQVFMCTSHVLFTDARGLNSDLSAVCLLNQQDISIP